MEHAGGVAEGGYRGGGSRRGDEEGSTNPHKQGQPRPSRDSVITD